MAYLVLYTVALFVYDKATVELEFLKSRWLAAIAAVGVAPVITCFWALAIVFTALSLDNIPPNVSLLTSFSVFLVIALVGSIKAYWHRFTMKQ